MRLISHRGNIDGPNKEMENNPEYINRALAMGYDVELDLWIVNGCMYLGHDKPQYMVDLEYLESVLSRIWIHCKNFDAINFMTSSDINFNYFWHENDSYTLTSHNFIWTYPNKNVDKRSIVLDFSAEATKKEYECYGLCSDFLI